MPLLDLLQKINCAASVKYSELWPYQVHIFLYFYTKRYRN